MHSTGLIHAIQVDRLKKPAILTDASCKGLRLEATISKNTGGLRKKWVYRYRTRTGKLKQMKLGEYPGMNVQTAKEVWRQQKTIRDNPTQGDPKKMLWLRASEERAAEQEEKRKGYSVKQLCLDYIAEHIEKRRVRTVEPRRLLEKEVIPFLGDRAACDIRRNDVHQLIQSIIDRKAPRIAQMVRTEFRAAYEHAISAGRLPEEHANPCSKVKAPPQVRRDRAFDERELKAFLKWLPLVGVSKTVRDVMRLELLTAARQGEIVAMRWKDVDLEREIWTQPKTKNGRSHQVMLSKQALELIKAREGLDTVYVFPLPSGKGHVGSKAIGVQQYVARNEMDIATWTVHDLRRSALTGLARLGCSRPVQNRIANHFDRSIAAIYDKHTYDAEAKKWLQQWADYLDEINEERADTSRIAKRFRRVRPAIGNASKTHLVARQTG